MRDADSDMDDDERHLLEMEMMKKHAQQTISVLQGDTIKLEDEMDKVSSTSTPPVPGDII